MKLRVFAIVALALAAATGWWLYRVADGESRTVLNEVETLKRLRTEDERRAAIDRGTAKELLDRIDVLQKKVAELEAAGRAREGELLAARADLEHLRRSAEEEADRLRRALATAEKEPAPTVTVEKPPVVVEKPPTPPSPPPPTLGPTAVSDPRQLQKLIDGLNALLRGVEGAEKWSIASAKAAEDDRLVTAVLEARGKDGEVAKSFQAGEVRLVLQGAAATLSIKMKDGSVTYAGRKAVPFPGGTYTVLLVVDPAPFRASGNPLLSVQ